MKAQTSIDPKLISLLGRKLYTGNPVVICARELLQNSVDACKRAGVDPEISITIKVEYSDPNNSWSPAKVRVICEDNGCGMSETELINDFLCLGGTSKKDSSSVGGFGIAKASIMSGEYWSVDTLGCHTDIEDVISGEDVRRIPEREGTKVEVMFSLKYFRSWELDELYGIIYSSDVSITLSVTGMMGYSDYMDSHAGCNADKALLHDRSLWKALASQKYAANRYNLGGKVFIRLRS